MTIMIGNHEFEGPVAAYDEIPASPGLFAVLHEENRELLLVDLNLSSDLSASLKSVAADLSKKMIVILRCDSQLQRKEILHELLREFEFEEDETAQSPFPRRTETKEGVALAI